MTADTTGPWWRDKGKRRRVRRIVTLVGACYLTGLATLNLAATPYGAFVNRIFPHIPLPQSVSTESVSTAWNIIHNNYVLRDVPASAATQGAEQGMIDMLNSTYHDRFSAYLTAAQYADFSAQLDGQRQGSVGITLEARCQGGAVCAADETPTILTFQDVLRNQPADKAGVHAGDILIAVNGTVVTSLGPTIDDRISKVGKLIRGEAGTGVDITVDRAGQQSTIHIVRDNLHIPSVFSQKFGDVLYLQVTDFGTDTADLSKSLLTAGLSGAGGAKSVVLDLRHNGGGYVTAAQGLASQFLETKSPSEEDVVVRRGRLSNDENPASAQQVIHDQILPGGVAFTPRLVVLVDGESASASEIVASAMKDYGRATIVGEHTFGKGSVQTDYQLPDGSDLHLTVERWYGPKGESIEGAGVTPDHVVALAQDDDRFRLDIQSPDASGDSQLQAALRLASGS